MRQLVFVHGRSQEHKDAQGLKEEWLNAFRAGLAKSNLQMPVPEDSIHFPYYGQALFDIVSGLPPETAADVIIRGQDTDTEAQEFTKSIVREICAREGISDLQVESLLSEDVITRGPLNWEWVQSALKAIDRYVPFGSGGSIAMFTNDVYQYLRNPGIRDRIEIGIRKALRSDVPSIVVSHSLGTVVAYSLLRRDGAINHWNVPLFVTLGSPLAVKAIRNALAPNSYPECVQNWFNVMDRRDVVALYPLTKENFKVDPEITNKTDVENHTPNRHGITGYLDDKEVARRIYDALTS